MMCYCWVLGENRCCSFKSRLLNREIGVLCYKGRDIINLVEIIYLDVR